MTYYILLNGHRHRQGNEPKGKVSGVKVGSHVGYLPLYLRELIANNFSGCDMSLITHPKELLATYYIFLNGLWYNQGGEGRGRVSSAKVGLTSHW